MPRARPLPPEERRAQLLTAARAVFARKGYFRAGVADIIAEAGVARGTFYNYFESKREVFDAVLTALTDDVERSVAIIDVTQPILPQVRANLDRLVRVIMDEDVARILFSEATGLDEDADEALRAFYGRVVARIAKALRRGQGMGIVREGDMQLTARCLMGVLKEPVFQARLFGEPVQPDQIVEELYALLTGGVLRQQ